MLISSRTPWPLFAILILNSLVLGACQPGHTKPSANQHQTPASNVALSREAQSHILFSEGIQKALMGDYKNAIQDYDQALNLAPSNSEVYYNRGVAYFSINRPQNAIADFNQAIALQPEMAEAYGNRGLIRLNLGDHQGALADYEEAKRIFQQRGDLSAAQQMQSWINQQAVPAQF